MSECGDGCEYDVTGLATVPGLKGREQALVADVDPWCLESEGDNAALRLELAHPPRLMG